MTRKGTRELTRREIAASVVLDDLDRGSALPVPGQIVVFDQILRLPACCQESRAAVVGAPTGVFQPAAIRVKPRSPDEPAALVEQPTTPRSRAMPGGVPRLHQTARCGEASEVKRVPLR